MFKIIFTDIKSMLKRPLLFLVMFFGIIAGAFSLIVYYISASNSQYLNENWASQDKTIEFYNCSISAPHIYKLMELLSDGSLPEIYYASVASYNSDDYDLIGVYNPNKTELKSGEMISNEYLGTNTATVSSDIKEEDISLGDKIRINGINYKVIGILSPGTYNPLTYDIRRITDGQSYVSGVDTQQTDTSLKNRPQKAIIVPLDVIPNFELSIANYDKGYFHITFTESLTQTEREEIEQKIFEAIYGLPTDMSQYSLVLDNNTAGELISYSAAVIAGLVNIITLFAYFLKENKKQYGIYKMLGASPVKIFIICLSELSLYTLFAFSIGAIGAVNFIERSGLFPNHTPITVWSLLLIYLLLLLVQVLASLKTIIELAYGKSFCFSSRKKYGDKPFPQKFLTLLSYRYSGKNIIHIASVSLLAMIISFVLTFGFSYVYDSGHYTRYVKNNYDCAVSAFSPSFYLDSEFYRNRTKCIDNIEDALNSLDNTYGIGKITNSGGCFAWTQEEASSLEYEFDKIVFLRSVNNSFAEYSPIPLSQGSWEAFSEYDSQNEDTAIPCIIPKDMEDRFPLNTEFTLKIEQYDDNGQISTIPRVFRVVGIADADALRPNYGYADEGNPNITTYQLSYTVTSEVREGGLATVQEFFIPEITIDGNVPDFQSGTIPTYFIYSDNYNNIKEWQSSLVKYGTVFSFEELCENYETEYKNGGGSTYFMHAVIAGTLLLLGIGGYSLMFFASMKKNYGVYYMCGMPWRKAIRLTLSGNGLDILLPGIIGSLLGIISVREIRQFSLDTIYLSALTGFLTIFAVFLITSIIISYLLSKYSPTGLLRNNQ